MTPPRLNAECDESSVEPITRGSDLLRFLALLGLCGGWIVAAWAWVSR